MKRKLFILTFIVLNFMNMHAQNSKLESFGLSDNVIEFVKISKSSIGIDTLFKTIDSYVIYKFDNYGNLKSWFDTTLKISNYYFYDSYNKLKLIKQYENEQYVSFTEFKKLDSIIIYKSYNTDSVIQSKGYYRIDTNDRIIEMALFDLENGLTKYQEFFEYDSNSLIILVNRVRKNQSSIVKFSNSILDNDKYDNWTYSVTESDFFMNRKVINKRLIRYK